MVPKPSTFDELKSQFKGIINLRDELVTIKRKRDEEDEIQKACLLPIKKYEMYSLSLTPFSI